MNGEVPCTRSPDVLERLLCLHVSRIDSNARLFKQDAHNVFSLVNGEQFLHPVPRCAGMTARLYRRIPCTGSHPNMVVDVLPPRCGSILFCPGNKSSSVPLVNELLKVRESSDAKTPRKE